MEGSHWSLSEVKITFGQGSLFLEQGPFIFFSQLSIFIDPELCDILQIAPDEMAKLVMKACA